MTLDLLFLSLIYRAQRGSLAISSPPSEERVLSPRLTDSKDKLFEWGMIILLCLLYYIIPSVYNFSNLFAPVVCGFLSWKVFSCTKVFMCFARQLFLIKTRQGWAECAGSLQSRSAEVWFWHSNCELSFVLYFHFHSNFSHLFSVILLWLCVSP